MIRVRQIADQLRSSLLFVPLAFVVGFTILSRVTLFVDRQWFLDPPDILETSVDSARSILTSLATGLIGAVALLLSLTLVVVQLASSQFSPRTSRDWLRDRSQQVGIGVVLGAAIYPLLILRETRGPMELRPLVPHFSVLVALFAGLVALLIVVRSVSYLGNSVQIGAVADRIARQTLTLIEETMAEQALEAESSLSLEMQPSLEVEPEDIVAVTAKESGWIQQLDEKQMASLCPVGSVVTLLVSSGSFIMEGQPIAWVTPAPHTQALEEARETVAIGVNRTMQEDVGFGLLRLLDIALRALSPGVNDPNTARDVTHHMGSILLALWSYPEADARRQVSGRTVISQVTTHADYLAESFAQLRRYGSSDVEMARTMLETLRTVAAEVERRDLPGPIAPIQDEIDCLVELITNNTTYAEADRRRSLGDPTAPDAVANILISPTNPPIQGMDS